MKLRFHARDDGPEGPMLVAVPYARPVTGQPPRYVGRKQIAVMVDGKPTYPRSDTPYECEENSDVGRRLVKLVRREGSLVPADDYTARACGVEVKAEPVRISAAKPSRKAGDE